MTMKIQKAEKWQRPLRAAIYGLSGGGKTMTSLRILRGMMLEENLPNARIGCIDTENFSASEYATQFDFDTIDLKDYSIESYAKAIDMFTEAGYRYLFIDSLTHGWQSLCEKVEKIAQAKYRGNTWSAWSEGTPEQRRLVRAINSFPGHIIATMRATTEWSQGDAGSGKSRPVRVGLKPEQGKGIEYEFDMLIAIGQDHVAEIQKDRSGVFQDKLIEKPGEDFGREIARAKKEGKMVVAKEKSDASTISDEQITEFAVLLERLGETMDSLTKGKLTQIADIPPAHYPAYKTKAESLCDERGV